MKGNDFGSLTLTLPKSIILPSLSITNSTETSKASAFNFIGLGSNLTP